MNTGIDAPESVPADSQGPIDVSVGSGTDSLTITLVGTDVIIQVDVDDEGRARFELPDGAAAGDTLHIIDLDNPDRTATISITPPIIGGLSS